MNNSRLRIKKNKLIKIIFSIIIFFITYSIIGFYQFGDQFHYRLFYTNLYGISLSDAFILAKSSISSIEPIYIIISWISSNLNIEKDLVMSLSNAILVYYAIAVMQLKKFNVSFLIIILIILNFYFIILFFAAERLRFAILFMFMATINTKKSAMYILLSITSHVQMLILYLFVLFKNIAFKIKTLYKFSFKTLFIMLSLIIILFLFKDYIIDKVSYYMKNPNLVDLIKPLLFFMLSILYSKNHKETILIFIPLFIGVLLIGGDRLNMFGYLIFLYYGLQVNRGLNFGVAIVSIYFFIKSIFFIDNILTYGNGFYR
jgi:hypothetical protein